MHTDKHIDLLLGADPEFLGLLTGGLRIAGPYDIEAIDVKALERRIDGVVLPEQPEEPIWAIEVQARREASALILRLLHRRLGALTDQQRARVQALPVEQLEDLGEALLDFTAPADLDAWLGEHPQPSKAD